MAAPTYEQAVGILVVVYLLLGLVLRSKRPAIPVWSLMAFASFVVVASGLVSVDELSSVIDMNVVLFLVGMFSLVGLAEESGLLQAVSYWFIGSVKRKSLLVIASSLLFGFLAAFAVNDTVALMGPPIALLISRVARIEPKAMFLLLAFSLTIGSVMTPIGNPQNMLIAISSGMPAPFVAFLSKLGPPTIINLVITPLIIMKLFGIKDERVDFGLVPHEALKNKRDAALAGAGLAATVIGLLVNDILEMRGLGHIAEKGLIPFVVAAGIYMFSSNPRRVLASVDWGTVVFFVTMFITMTGVWRSGAVEPLFRALLPRRMEGADMVLRVTVTSLLASQFLSNVPFTSLYITYLKGLGYSGADTHAWLTLAAMSTIAGNLTVLGAASNVIVLESLESRYGTTVSFVDFFKVGAVVTAVNAAVYLAFLAVPL